MRVGLESGFCWTRIRMLFGFHKSEMGGFFDDSSGYRRVPRWLIWIHVYIYTYTHCIHIRQRYAYTYAMVYVYIYIYIYIYTHSQYINMYNIYTPDGDFESVKINHSCVKSSIVAGQQIMVGWWSTEIMILVYQLGERGFKWHLSSFQGLGDYK